MESRTEKYSKEDSYQQTETNLTRSNRNARLYRQVYGKYEDLDNLPIDDNTDEIDMEKLRELVLNSNQKQEEKEVRENLNILEQKKRKIDEQRIYDINKILEKAKYENNKLKATTNAINNSKSNRNILSTLESTELSLAEIQKESEKYQQNQNEKENLVEEQLSMTRELKYQSLIQEENKSSELPTTSTASDLSLDLFDDLKPTGNTIVTKPIKEDNNLEKKRVREDFHSTDTKDIDIIKPEQKNIESDFFTSSYEFSKKDFTQDDDFYEAENKGGICKILLLILAITIFIGVIVYFIGTYGLGI